MVATVQKATEVFEKLSEQDQILAMEFLLRLAKIQELERAKRNSEYLEKVQRAMTQIAQGGGTVRDIIEVSENE